MSTCSICGREYFGTFTRGGWMSGACHGGGTTMTDDAFVPQPGDVFLDADDTVWEYDGTWMRSMAEEIECFADVLADSGPLRLLTVTRAIDRPEPGETL